MIVVTGATGSIGVHLVNELKNKYKIKCFVRDTSDTSKLDLKKIKVYTGSLFNKLDIEDCIKGAKAVIHLAALVDSLNKKELYKHNVIATKNIVEACREQKVKLIYMSSVSALLKDKHNYGKSKLMAEQVVKKSGVNYVIIRPTTVYDNKGKTDIATIIRMLRLSKIIPLIDKGKNMLQPVYVGDLIKLIKIIIEKNISNKEINIGGRDKISFRNLIIKISKRMNKKIYLVNIPLVLKTKRIKQFLGNKTVDNSYAEKLLGKVVGIDEGLDVVFEKKKKF